MIFGMTKEERRAHEDYLADYWLSDWVIKAARGLDEEARRIIRARVKRAIAEAVELNCSNGHPLGHATRLALKQLGNPKARLQENLEEFAGHIKPLPPHEEEELLKQLELLFGKKRKKTRWQIPFSFALILAGLSASILHDLDSVGSWFGPWTVGTIGLLFWVFCSLIALRLLAKILREYLVALEQTGTPPPTLRAVLGAAPRG